MYPVIYLIGVILFSDPADVAVQGTAPEDVYPNTIFLPGTGVQRGSTYIGDGDPLSPHWASVPNAYRYNLTHLFIPFQMLMYLHDMRYKLKL